MRVALIGLGMVADMHVAAVRDAGLDLACVLGRDPVKAQAFGARHDVAVAADLQDLIARGPDFVIIATPPDARLSYAQALTAATIPILMEKPIERDARRARQIVDLCTAAGVPLGVVLQHRMRPAAQDLAARVVRGDLGQIATVDLSVPWWRDQSYYDAPGRGTFARDGGGVLITQAIHQIDLMLQLCGPVTEVRAMTATSALHDLEAEDFATASLRFASGAVGNLVASVTHYPGGAESLTLNGTKASAVLSAAELRVMRHGSDTPEHVGGQARTGGGADPMAFSHGWHQAVIEDFAEALGHGRAPAITGASALGAHLLIDAIQEAARSGQAVQVETSHG